MGYGIVVLVAYCRIYGWIFVTALGQLDWDASLVMLGANCLPTLVIRSPVGLPYPNLPLRRCHASDVSGLAAGFGLAAERLCIDRLVLLAAVCWTLS